MESESCKYCGMSGAHSPECPTQFKVNKDDDITEAEKEKTLSEAEEGREEADSRVLSDAHKITGKHYDADAYDDDYFDDPKHGGARYVIDKGAQTPRLEFTEKQVENARHEMNVDISLKEEEEKKQAEAKEYHKRVMEVIKSVVSKGRYQITEVNDVISVVIDKLGINSRNYDKEMERLERSMRIRDTVSDEIRKVAEKTGIRDLSLKEIKDLLEKDIAAATSESDKINLENRLKQFKIRHGRYLRSLNIF